MKIIKKAFFNTYNRNSERPFLLLLTTNKPIKSITIMAKLNKTKTFRISETQLKTLQKMKSYNVDVGRFIRESIKEKIDKEYSYIIEKKNDKRDWFLKSLDKAIKLID